MLGNVESDYLKKNIFGQFESLFSFDSDGEHKSKDIFFDLRREVNVRLRLENSSALKFLKDFVEIETLSESIVDFVEKIQTSFLVIHFGL